MITTVLTLTLGLIFAFAAAGKLRDIRGFVTAVRAFDVLPRSVATVFGYALPLVELVAGALLVTGLWPHVASGLALLLSASFTIALGVNAWRGRAVDCHCFGAAGVHRVSWQALARSMLLLAGSGWLFCSTTPTRPVDAAQVLPQIAIAATAALAYALISVWLDVSAVGAKHAQPTLNYDTQLQGD